MIKKKKAQSSRDARINALFGELMHHHAGPNEQVSSGGIIVPETKYGDDFDIVGLMNEARDPDTGLLRDLKIDDRDLAHASSFYDYAFTIIGEDAHPPWMVQMWTGLLLFSEVCPVCSDKRWLDLEWFIEHVDKSMPSKDVKQGLKILKHGVCPKCKRTKHDLIVNHGMHNYTELVNVLGQRSGKSSSASLYASYHTHRMLKFPRLADHTKAMQKSTELTGTFVSLTFAKALGLLWTPFINIINESRWYAQYHSLLDHYGEKYGVELYRKKDEFIKYFHRSMKLYPTNPKSQTLRGDTRFLAVIDELGLFPLPSGNDEEDEKSDRANADEAHKSLTNSLVTVQAIQGDLLAQGLNCPPALMIGVSSPISMRDKVMRRLQDAKTVEGKKFILGVNLPTWKVNPSINRDTPIITLAYASNPEKAERDFGANPPRVHQTFIKPSQVNPILFSVKNTHAIKYHYDKPGLLYAKVECLYRPKYPSVVCIDAGHSNNSFTLIGAHFDFATQKTVVTTCVELMTHDNRKIDFNSTYLNVILPILKDINGVVLLADQWQSLDILSRAQSDMGLVPMAGKEKPRCMAKQYSPRRRDFDSLVAMIENESMALPLLPETDYKHVVSDYIEFKTLNGQPVKHLLLQMLTVRDAGEGKCPEKGEGYTDDIFRALVLTTKIHHESIMLRLKTADESVVAKERRAMPTPIFVPRAF
jgi:hypothetical protein